MSGAIRWGVLGTAAIAPRAFLPALREAGGGTAAVVAGRDLSRAEEFAARNGVEQAVRGYEAVIEDPSIDAVYIPLPNALHAQWTIAALEAGKAVLCEKPLSLTAEEAGKVIEVARRSARPLWEAFVFPFHPQTARLRGLLAEGAIGELREIWSSFHFTMQGTEDIRLEAALGGGALYDVGCYPVRLAHLLFGGDAVDGHAVVVKGDAGVDIETSGVLEFESGRLMMSCGFALPFTTWTRLVGTGGEIRLTNPFHPEPHDGIEVWREGRLVARHEPGEGTAFSWGIRHIHEVLRGEAEPRHTAADDSLGTARALDLLR
ncbi:Gfo/Idh/MocA family protein [Microbispora sp. H11081]|uniref:Gfo/Idh/MocA family protein n=1 Tax=Microbispora sp. H11081 TaxID=2729107 RepID=UPI001473D142|nr:Gfo/Idh/MocA family oxidoreductase [Microbispora sp. H11081]